MPTLLFIYNPMTEGDATFYFSSKLSVQNGRNRTNKKKKKKTFRGESMPIKVELIPTVVHFFSSRFSHSTCPHHTLRKQRREGRELTKKKNSNPAYNFPLCCFVCVCLISSCVPVAVRVCVWPQPSLNPKFALFECRCH